MGRGVLVKYVLVGASGVWLNMDSDRFKMESDCKRVPGTHVECWVYPILPNGTHGTPTKRSLE